MDNADKVLSLYETDTQVIVRGKAGGEVEFGNTLLLAEPRDGVIVDWQLQRDSAPADARQLPESVARLETAYGVGTIRALGTDRGFCSAANQTLLKAKGIYDGICPKHPARLKERMAEARFVQLQRRRSQTEGRIAIFKNGYLCSLPVLKDFTTLSDGRVICKRDVSAVILDDQQASRICEKVKEDLDRQFIRFITFPETNVTVELMDRIRLQELYKIIGNDYSCPNTLGCAETKTNDGQRFFKVSILSGQPQEDLMTTCVHEYAHVWTIENMPPARAEKIGKDAVEGFCELLSYLYAEQQGVAAGKSNILANHYTRGQIHLFIAAHRQYGFQDIVDWMISGDDPLLLRDDLSRVRRLEDRPKTNIAATNTPPVSVGTATSNPPPKPPEQLCLQGITGSKTQPMALINGHTFSVNEEARVPVSSSNVVVRCVAIREDAVVVQVGGVGELRTLTLRRK